MPAIGTGQDLTGKKFGRWTVLGISHRNKWKAIYWNCLCECGNRKAVCCSSLKNGKSQSCGCYKVERTKETLTTHGQSGKAMTKEYRAWKLMKGRCENTSDKAYPNYGGRGIKVCRKWSESFEDFFRDVGPVPGLAAKRLYSLGRIDNNGNYEPGNVRWETAMQQSNNRRFNKRVTIDGETRTLSQWLRHFDMPMSTYRNRLSRKGWSPERALTTPVRR